LPEFPELRDSAEIQGNILAGFRKDHQRLAFLAFGDPARAQSWLGWLSPRIARTDQVATFNRLFSAARRRGGGDPEILKAVWVNVSLTAMGIRRIASPDPFRSDQSDAFLVGAAASAERIGDSGPSAPNLWLFGRADQTIDAVLTVQADRPSDLEVELARHYAAFAEFGLSIVFEQDGDTLPGARAGHEHFGFRDGISQPGVRGFDEPDDVSGEQVLHHPGTDLVNAGEFVIGYKGQGADRVLPAWMKNGSFHVIRRLAQDVPGWWAQIERESETLAGADSIAPDLLAAKTVGRWRSGTPLDMAPDRDLRSGRDPEEDNAFEYEDDPEGLRTPRFAHIRKVYPRRSVPPGEEEAERRRIIRRGIPFGLPFDPGLGRGHGVDAERGLVFAAFMVSIEDQFEFLQLQWANTVDFPAPSDGADAVIGTGSPVTLKREGRTDGTLSFTRLVTTEGSLYAFAPSLSSLNVLARGEALAP
jgi:Dyp-type peroxidase family